MPRPAHPAAQVLTREFDAWQTPRNTHNAKADWHFTRADARIKLKRLYRALYSKRVGPIARVKAPGNAWSIARHANQKW
jgi:hypothetical protein